MYKLFLTLRYLRSKWIAVFAMLSVWLCVAMVLIVFSVMDGFLENIKEHSRGLLSEVIVDVGTLQGFPYYQEFTEYMHTQLPDTVEQVSPVIYNYAIMRVKTGLARNITKPVRIVGIDLDGYSSVNTFKQGLYYEKYYPGTTTFRPKAQPVAGIKDIPPAGDISTFGEISELNLDYVLPPDLERAFAHFRETHPDDPVVLNPKSESSAPNGVGRFEQNYDMPGYEGAPLPGLIVGMDVIYTRGENGEYDRGMARGEEIVLTLLPMTRMGTLAEDPIPLAVRLIDESRTGVYQIDSVCVYADFKLMQRLLSMDALERSDGTYTKPRANQLLVHTRAGVDADEAAHRINDLWGEFCMNVIYNLPPERYRELGEMDKLRLWQGIYQDATIEIDPEDALLMGQVGVETWQDRQRDFIDAVEKEKVLVTILFVIISVVAVVLIGVIFHMIVLQKTRDIGIIKSMGATRLGVALIFLSYGAAVGVLGGILGVVTGSIFVHYINDIQNLLAQLNPQLRVWSPAVYTFDEIPNVVKPWAAVAVFAAAVATSMLGAAWPAIKAARVWPVQALRYE